MSELIQHAPAGQGPNGVVTSLELVKEINMFREQEGNRSEMQHKTLLSIIRDEFEGGMQNILLTSYVHPQNNQTYEMFELTPSQAKQVLVRESKFVRRGVIAKLEKLEANAKTYQLPTTYLEALKQLTAETEVKMQLQLENQEIKQERDKVLVINELQEHQIQEQDAVIKQATPKVEFFDKTMQADSLLATSNIASELGMSAYSLNEKLKDMNVQHKVNGVWTLKAKYASQGLARYKVTGHNDTSGKWIADTHLYWTQKGRHFINSLFNKTLVNQNIYQNASNLSNNQTNLAIR